MAARSVAAIAFLFSVFAIGQVAVVQRPDVVRSSDAEMQLIRNELGLDALSAEESAKILSIDAYRWSESEPYELAAFIWLRPVFVQGAICISQEFAMHGRPTSEEYTWEHQKRYHHWLGQSPSDCALESPDELPQSVVTRERIATDAMVRILESEHEILQLALNRLEQQDVADLPGEWLLEEVSVSSRLNPESGLSYHAKFAAPGALRGPGCTFTIRDGVIQVHGADIWVV